MESPPRMMKKKERGGNNGQFESRIFDGFRISTTKVNALLTDEIENAIDPNSHGIRLWHHVLLVCTLFEAFVLPYFFMFKPNAPREQPRELYGVVVCEFIFLLDVVVQAHTGYYHDGNIVRDRAKTRRRYLKSRTFRMDLLVLIPFSLVVNVSMLARATMEMHKLLRWFKLRTYIATLDDMYAKQFVAMKVLKMIVATIYLSHFVACMRFGFGYDEHEHDEWLPPMPHEPPTVQRQYLMSLFWAFGVLTGLFEGELPTTIPEFLFTIFVAVCGFSLFASVCAMFFMISKCESGNSEAAEAQINQLKHLLSFHRVPEPLQKQAIDYLRGYCTDVESNDREVMKLLCPSITKDIQVELMKDTVARIPLFEGCTEKFIIALSSLLDLVSLPAQSTVFQVGEHGDSMYIVHTGVFNVIINGVTVREMRKGTCFGELSVFSNSPRSATIVSATYSTLYKLSRFHGERLLEGYPECANKIAHTVASVTSKGVVLKKAGTNTSSGSKFNIKGIDAAAIGAKLRHGVTATTTSIFSKRKKTNYVIPGVEDIEDPAGDEDEASNEPAATSNKDMLQKYYDKKVGANEAETMSRMGWFVRKLLFRRCIDAQSSIRVWWLVVLELAQTYNWITIPLRLCFPFFSRPIWYFDAGNILADMILLADVYLNFNLSYTVDSEKIMDTSRSALRYFKGSFVFDLICVMPFWKIGDSSGHYILRIPRLLRSSAWYWHYLEVSTFLQLTNRGRLLILAFFLVMLYHGIACLHFSMSNVEGFSHEEDAWIACHDVYLEKINDTHYNGPNSTIYSVDDSELHEIAATQYFRSLYYATNVLAALGKTIEPDSDLQYAVALCFMLSGFLITAVVVDNVQKRFTASAYEQKQFYGKRTRIQLFLRRQNAPGAIFQRVNSFLDYWWSSHRGAFISELLADLPAPIKREILHSICSPALQTLGLLAGVRPFLDKLEDFFVTNAKFILYGQGEVVYRQGDYANGIFFLLEGEVCVIANAQNPREVQPGGFFGTAVVKPKESADGYGEHVSATKGCILLFVSHDHLFAMEEIFPGLPHELVVLEAKLLNNKLMKTDYRISAGRAGSRNSVTTPTATGGANPSNWWRHFGKSGAAFDPDSKFIMLWETWLFLAMTMQWLAVTVQICFRMKSERYFQADVMTAILELAFFFDVYLRSRLGFYAYGNKIMAPRVIRKSYFRSKAFLIDVLSLLPLYAVNWFRLPELRLDGLNINKIIRVFKVPSQLRALENRYLKHTTELRLFKLFYYTFLLAHIFGCMWFDFASNSSHIINTTGSQTTEFGDDEWLPPKKLETSELNLQYFASIFWSFGLMSASSTGELPKTAHECIFSVLTMTSGFFLFAYVVGNFTDIIELGDGDNREFVERLSAVRLLLSHFTLPKTIEERLKTYYCFIRFHTITQEHHLERCLPPSLLTDIRLVHLQPMIAKVSFLSGMEGSVTRMLVSQFSQMLILRDQYVCKFGEEGYDMFFVFTGVLDVLLPAEMVTSEETSEGIDGQEKQGENATPSCALDTQDALIGRLKKVNELTSGSYFGENGLFTKGLRNAYIRASTSCILYKLSRESLELVFDRYPQWKEKVLRIANLQKEQQRLARLSAEEQHRHSDQSNGSMLSRIDVLNRRAERMEEELQLVRLRRMDSSLSSNANKSTMAKWWDRLVRDPCVGVWSGLVHGADAQSSFHRKWLGLTTVCTIYTAFFIPYRVAIDSLDRSTGIAPLMKAFQLMCEVIFAVDIWFSWRVKVCAQSMELYEQTYQLSYRKERFIWDVIAAIPLDRLLTDFTHSYWFRLLRCLKIRNVVGYMSELNRRSVSIESNRIRGVCLLYVLAIYWMACSYLAISMNFGFGEEWNAWRPSTSLEIADVTNVSSEQVTLRLLRGYFFGITAFVKKGRTFIPDSTPLYIFSVLACFTGMLVMSFMIGEFASLYISNIWTEVDFRKNHIAVELYLDRLQVSDELKRRTQRFMSALWSSHSGVNYEVIFEDMPESIKSASIMHIAQRPLRLFMSSTFRLLTCESMKDMDEFTRMVAQRLRFEGYPRDEIVVTEGSISRAMYFVVRGHLVMSSTTTPGIARSILRKGDHFGDRGLIGCAVSAFTVRTVRACDLLSLSSETLLKILEENPFSLLALTLVQRVQTDSLASRLLTEECSREQMETKWGEALLSQLLKLRDESRQGSLSGPLSASRLPVVYIDRLVDSIANASDAMRLFQSFLSLVLPFDSLDWKASVARIKLEMRGMTPISVAHDHLTSHNDAGAAHLAAFLDKHGHGVKAPISLPETDKLILEEKEMTGHAESQVESALATAVLLTDDVPSKPTKSKEEHGHQSAGGKIQEMLLESFVLVSSGGDMHQAVEEKRPVCFDGENKELL